MHHANPRSLLTPRMREVLDRMARARRVPMHMLEAQQARALYEAGAGVLDIPPHKMDRVQTLQIPVRDGTLLNAELMVPLSVSSLTTQAGMPVLLFFHGGGFTVGSVATHRSLCCHLAHLGQCAVLSVDYRLAPEHKFPVAFHDGWDSLAWLRNHGHCHGLDVNRIAIGGDSAGGTLTLACAISARDHGWPVRLQVLFYPGCAAEQTSPSHHTYAHGFVIERETIGWMFDQYLNSSSERHDWRFAPLEASDLEGVAPAWMGLAECDPLVDEGIEMADRLRWAGVAVDLEIYRGVVHEFIKMGRAIPEAMTAHQDAGRALRKAFATN